MPDYDWEPLLREVSRAIITNGSEETIESLKWRGIRVSNDRYFWLGRAPADSEAIAELEKHIGAELPPDYRQFLAITDEWEFSFWEDSNGQHCYYPFGICNLEPSHVVDWFEKLDHKIGRLEEFTEGLNDQDLVWDQCPAGHLRRALQIGESDGNECILLNPNVVNERGEWQTITVIEDGADISLYPSFWEFMHDDPPPLSEQNTECTR